MFKDGKMDIHNDPWPGKRRIQENKFANLNSLEKEPYTSKYLNRGTHREKPKHNLGHIDKSDAF